LTTILDIKLVIRDGKYYLRCHHELPTNAGELTNDVLKENHANSQEVLIPTPTPGTLGTQMLPFYGEVEGLSRIAKFLSSLSKAMPMMAASAMANGDARFKYHDYSMPNHLTQ
jgi:hypothetical protein